LTKTKSKLSQRKSQSKQQLQWIGNITRSKVLTIRFIPVDEMALNFAQISVELQSVQQIALVDSKSKTVLKETPQKQLEEIWVFERVTNKPDEKWKWCGTLPLAPGEESLLDIQAKQQGQ
jgi:hypothetical protein